MRSTDVMGPPQAPGTQLRQAASTDLLPFVESVVARYLPAGSEERQTVDGLLARLHQRLDDPALYLAVIGGFNTGKSTLINALIGVPLLKMDGIPTTTTPQMVTHGERLDLEVAFTDGQRYRSSNQLGRLWRRLRSLDPSIPRRPFKRILRRRRTIEELIALIGADELLTPHIESCTIFLPSPHLRAGLAIIDTPGVNSTNAAHRKTALKAINERADLIVVTAPVQLQIDRDFDMFLQDNAQPYLSRCLFVATRGDDVQPEALEGIEKRIRRQIRDLGGDDSRFMTTAAQPSLKAATKAADLTPTEREWVRRFDETRRTLMGMMEAEQIAAIQETIERLTQTLTASVAATLQRQIATWEERAEALRREAIGDLGAYTDQARATLETAIQAATNAQEGRLLSAINAAKSSALTTLRAAISGAQNEAALDAIAANQVGPTTNAAFVSIEQQTKTAQQAIISASQEAERSFVAEFSDTFRRLITAAGTLTSAQPEIHVAALPPVTATSYSHDLSSIFNSKKDRGLRNVARKIFRRKQQREEYRAELNRIVAADVQAEADEYARQVQNSIDALKTALSRHGNDLIAAYVAHYRQVYDDILRQQAKARNEVEQHRKDTEETLAELRLRQARVFAG